MPKEEAETIRYAPSMPRLVWTTYSKRPWKGLFIAMPSRKASDGEYRDIAHPINSNTREKIQSLILEKYEEVMAEDAVAYNA